MEQLTTGQIDYMTKAMSEAVCCDDCWDRAIDCVSKSDTAPVWPPVSEKDGEVWLDAAREWAAKIVLEGNLVGPDGHCQDCRL